MKKDVKEAAVRAATESVLNGRPSFEELKETCDALPEGAVEELAGPTRPTFEEMLDLSIRVVRAGKELLHVVQTFRKPKA